VPALGDRADLELLLRRAHLIRLRTSAKNRIFGLLTQWGVRASVAHLRTPGAVEALAEPGVPERWRDSIAEAVAVIELLDQRVEPINESLLEVARADERARLLRTIPGVGWQLALTFAVEIGDVSKFPSASKLVGYSGLVPRVHQSGERSRTGRLSRAGSPLLRWAAVEAAQHAWREQNPWHRLYVDVRARHGNGNAAKSAVARKVLRGLARVVAPATLQACRRLRGGFPCPGKLQPASGRLTARLRIEKPGQLRPDTMRRPSAERELSTTSASPEHGGTRTDRG